MFDLKSLQANYSDPPTHRNPYGVRIVKTVRFIGRSLTHNNYCHSVHTCTVEPVIILTDSALCPFFLSLSLNTASHDLFLQLIPRVPLNVPHLGHFLTPRIVGFPRSLIRVFNFSGVIDVAIVSFRWSALKTNNI